MQINMFSKIIFKGKNICKLGRECLQRKAFPNTSRNNLVIHIGNIHDVLDVVATETQVTLHQIKKEKSAVVPNMRDIINGRTACVHLDRTLVKRVESFQTSRQGIIEFEAQR